MLRQAETVSPSSTIAISAITSSVPRRATVRGEPGLVARAIGVLLCILLLWRILIEIRKTFLGYLVNVAFEPAQPAHDARGDGETDLPSYHDQDSCRSSPKSSLTK